MATKPMVNARAVLPNAWSCHGGGASGAGPPWVQANLKSRDYIPVNKTGFCRG